MAKKKRRHRTRRSPRRKNTVRPLLRRVLLRTVLFVAGLSAGLLGPWVWWVDRQTTQRFADHHLTETSHVYARPLELHDGMEMQRRDLLVEIEAAGLRSGDPAVPGRFSLSGNRIRLHVPARSEERRVGTVSKCT